MEDSTAVDSIDLLMATIQTMEKSRICQHPIHKHSFQATSFPWWSKCAGCQQRLSWRNGLIVRCIACGAVAHRSCATGSSIVWTESCPVNGTEPMRHRLDESGDFAVVDIVESNDSDPVLLDEDGEETLEPETVKAMDSLEEEAENDEALHFANHPFASVSRALQENILAHFRGKSTETESTESDSTASTDAAEALATKSDPSPPPDREPHLIVKLASGTYEAVKTSVAIPRRMGVATVAGGLAGGVAGLAMAGPAGAMAGYQWGQAAGALGVVLEGSVSIGVIVASVATAGYTAQQIQDQMMERRVLTMGEDGISRKVLLVRPNIQIDPEWEEICNEAKREALKQSGSSSLSFFSSVTDDRYSRDQDIIVASEDEIPTKEKVLLLVSRILNDKSSLPGFVYRSLIETFEKRCALEDDSDEPSRSRRDDAHALIKHVTATLLDVRPGFGSSAALTEQTATAVEGLVFGKLYDPVMEEIVCETAERDESLLCKIDARAKVDSSVEPVGLVSPQALEVLSLLPQAHSAVDKLEYCVRFLELISEQFSRSNGSICADSLLKMVCQHIVAAKLPRLNAEVAFLEEFARDEQLLRGREGYSLVTLQASLHFLNVSTDIEQDIFGQEDEEENIPVDSMEAEPLKC